MFFFGPLTSYEQTRPCRTFRVVEGVYALWRYTLVIPPGILRLAPRIHMLHPGMLRVDHGILDPARRIHRLCPGKHKLHPRISGRHLE